MQLRTQRFLLVVCGGLMVAGSVLGLTVPAQAHNYLVSSTPAADSTLTVLPDEFVITTNDDLLELGGVDNAFALQVRDSDGLYYGDGCVGIAGPTMTATPALGPAGLYTVVWQVVSADGHPVSDEFTFTWAPESDAELSTGSSTAPACGGADDEPETGDPEPSDVAAATGSSSDAIWIAGAGLAVLITVVSTLLLVRRANTRSRSRRPGMAQRGDRQHGDPEG